LLLEFLLTHCFRPGLSTAIHYQGQPNTHEPANDARKGLNPEINQYGIHKLASITLETWRMELHGIPVNLPCSRVSSSSSARQTQ
jgi:hypothetical protein